MVTDSAQQLAPEQRLASGTLTIPDAIAISVSVIAPGMAMFLNVPGVAIVAGGSTPLAFLLGGIGCLALAFVVIGFTRRMASAGYAYTYASRSLGKSAGFMAGWLYAFGLACFVPMTMAGVAFLFSDLVGLGSTWYFPLFLIGMVLLVVLSIVRIKVTTRLQLLIGIATVAVILIVNIWTTAKGGAHGNTAAPFSFSHTVSGGFHGVFYGIILGVTSYIGFETAADFGEETRNPRRAIPIAIIAATVFAIVLYLWTTYSLSIGFGVNKGAAFGSDPFALKTVASRYAAHWVGTLTEIGAMLAAFIVCVACATASTRTLYAMGREGVFPGWLGRTHHRFQTPANATVAVALVSIGMGAISWFGFGNELGNTPITTYFFWATIGTLAVIVVYVMLCFGGIVFFRRTKRQWNPGAHVVVPLIGAVVFGAALYGSIYPVPPHPLNYTPYITVAWIVLGLIVLAGLRARRPEAVERIGSILGEEGGEEAADLDQPAALGKAAPTVT
jgi:amino acid transporter